jgi:hypothetical protein
MNIFLLKKVRQAILDHPEAFDMGQWDCETAACIAGWTVRLGSNEKLKGAFIFNEAQRLLKISDEQACYLFQSWCRNANLEMTAEEAAQHIDRFIESDGKIPFDY